jgi:molecular chaperone GrpE
MKKTSHIEPKVNEEKETSCAKEDPTEKDPLAQCEEEKALLKDQLLRTLAELENLRKRAAREREETLKYSVTKFAKDSLAVLDALQKALTVSEETPVATILAGLRMAEKEFLATLQRHGVQTLSVQKGDLFDPTHHQAMFETEETDVPPGHIVDILQIGYCLQDRLLRPALVGVAKKASPEATT